MKYLSREHASAIEYFNTRCGVDQDISELAEVEILSSLLAAEKQQVAGSPVAAV